MYKTVAIMGVGAIGSYLLWGLSKKENIDLCVIADGERKKRYEQDGFIINGELYRPVIKTPVDAKGVDLLIIGTKYNALKASLSDIVEIVGDNTNVISFLNGVDSEEIIAEVIDPAKIIYSVIKVASERVGNEVRFAETAKGVIYGEKDGSMTERIYALDELFKDTGLHYRGTEYILSEMWAKFRLNVPGNQTQAMIGCGVGAYQDSEHAKFLRQAITAEVDALAKAKGIDISKADKSSETGSKTEKRARLSMLQDMDAKRHTEVDMFAGAVVRMGKELGIPTPYNEFTYHMIKALEEKNDGLFDYD